MSINTINNVAFKARTSEGNRYEKSAEGKKVITALDVASVATIAAVSKFSGLDSDIIRVVEKQTKEKIDKHFFKVSKSAAFLAIALLSLPFALLVGQVYDMFINHTRRKDADRMANTGHIPVDTNTGKITLGAIGAGLAAITAGMIGNTIKFGQDKLAELKDELRADVKRPKTKGAKATKMNATIRKATASQIKELEEVQKILTKHSGLIKLGLPAMMLVGSLVGGAVYDHGVNKFRDELDQQKRNDMTRRLFF